MKTPKLLLLAGLIGLSACQLKGSDEQKIETADESKNQVVETIMARRSIRKYTDRQVERDKLELIAKCGINAPSGMNKQPWEIRIVESKDYIDGVTELFKEANPKMAEDPNFKNMFRNAPAVIFIGSPVQGGGEFDCGLAAENMMLAAQSLGLGTCCLGGPIRFLTTEKSAKPYLDKLEFSPDYKLLIAIGVGYPDESPEAKPRDNGKIKFIY